MSAKFELRTRLQFSGLIARQARWNDLRTDPACSPRFKQLLEATWARENCTLDAILEHPSKHIEPADAHLQAHVAAAAKLFSLAQQKDHPDAEDLMEIHRLMLAGLSDGGRYRLSDGCPEGETHLPVSGEIVPLAVDNALGWFQSNSFADMHEIEQTALMLAKLIDIQPFEEANGRTLRLFSNFFLLKSGYPPAIIPANQASQYSTAIQGCLRFHTQPMIDLLTDSVGRNLAICLGESPAPAKFKILT